MKKNVYVTGYYFDKDKGSIPCYWINGTKLILPIDGYDGTVNNIYVDNLDVYISGDYVNDGSMACYWKNGIRTDLNSSSPDGGKPPPAFLNNIPSNDRTVRTIKQFQPAF